MRSQQLNIALTVADTLSITKAARRLYLSQPTVSGSLKSLESEIGFAVFQRTNKGLTITPKGQEFLRCARVVMEQYRQIEHIAEDVKRVQLRVFSFSSRRVENAFHALCRLHGAEKWLDLSLSTQLRTIREAISALYSGEADVVLSYCPAHVADGLPDQFESKAVCCHYLASSPVVLLTARSHPLSELALTPENVSRYVYIGYHQYPGQETGFLPHHYAQAVRRDSRIFVGSAELRLKLLSDGLGYAAGMPIDDKELRQYGLVSRPIEGAHADLICLLPEAKQKDPLAREFISLVRREYGLDEP